MTSRSVPPWLADIVGELELDRPRVVTRDIMDEIRVRLQVQPPTARIIQELHARGWLLKTGAHGAWEFVPGERAGAISSGDPFLTLRATFETTGVPAFVALGSAMWLLDIADRAPDRAEIALPTGRRAPAALRREYRTVHHESRLEPVRIHDLPVHRPATVLVHLATKPTDVRSWASVLEGLSTLLDSSPEDEIQAELEDRSHATRVRLAYLINGLAPELVKRLGIESSGTVWFGPRRTLRRHNARWKIADTVLPSPPPGSVDVE